MTGMPFRLEQFDSARQVFDLTAHGRSPWGERSVLQLANESVAPCTLLQLPRLLYDVDEPLEN